MLDLDAYLRRIGYVGSREPTVATLSAICAAQVAAIAFENLDPLLGRAPMLALDALQSKLVEQRRGGYCFELNALLRAALLMLGFRVASLAARVVFMAASDAPPRPRSHMLLQVRLPNANPTAPNESFIADAGFGGHLLGAPLRLEPGAEQTTPTGVQRTTVLADGYYAVEAKLPAGWSRLYRFTLEPLLPMDYEPLNWFTATHPNSIFMHNLLMERLTLPTRATLLNDRLTLREAGKAPQERLIDTAAEFAQVLDAVFDVQPPVSAQKLFARIPKRHAGVFMPGA